MSSGVHFNCHVPDRCAPCFQLYLNHGWEHDMDFSAGRGNDKMYKMGEGAGRGKMLLNAVS